MENGKVMVVISEICLTILAILGWFSLTVQFYLNITSNVASVPEIIIRYFSYFTLDTNFIVAACCTVLLLKSNSRWIRFISNQKTLTAVTVYIVIVGIIYNLILRVLWNPEGLQKVIDELLHSVIPLLFFVYWLFFVSKNQLDWRDVFLWLIYPLVYTVFIMIRGNFSEFYPYPFINVKELGIHKALINAVGIAFFFLVVSLLFVAIGKLLNRKNI
ncbi:MAG: Pr6Pr family membrane protein [Chitinophagales bacterium]|nr:Pr6Pr family membrane protein [Chitinophagales bacterium]